MSLLDVLQQVHNPTTQAQAEKQLKHAEETNFPVYVLELSKVLVNDAASVSVRALAGILLTELIR